MSDKSKNSGEERVELLTTASIAAQLAFAADNHESGFVYGGMQRYFSNKLSELGGRISGVSNIGAMQQEKEDIAKNPSNNGAYTPYGYQATAQSVAADLRIEEIANQIEGLKKPVAMPSVDSMYSIRAMLSDVDSTLLNANVELYQIKHWKELTFEQKQVFLPVLEEINKMDYDRKVQEREDYYNNAKPENVMSRRGEATRMVDRIEGDRIYTMPPVLPPIPKYRPLVLDKSDTLERYAIRAVSLGESRITETTDLMKEKVDRLMGEFPSTKMSDYELESAINDKWKVFETRTAITVASGFVGAGLTAPAIKLIGVTGKIAMPTAQAYISSQTGIVFAEAGVAKAITTHGMQRVAELAPKVLTNGATKTGGFTMGIAGGAASETPIDMGLSSLLLGKGGVGDLADYGLTMPQPKDGEIKEMMKDKVYEDVNPLEWAFYKLGYDEMHMQNPKMLLRGEAIPSLSVSFEDFADGVDGKNEEIAARIETVTQFNEFYHQCDAAMQDYHYSAEKVEREWAEVEQQAELLGNGLAATDIDIAGTKNEIAKNNVHDR